MERRRQRIRQHMDTDEVWRLFSALPLDDAARAVIAGVQAALHRQDWPVRWIDPQLAHITLRFYGDTDVDLIPNLRGRLADIAAMHRPMSLTLDRLGAFPTVARPRVIWLGLDGDLAAVQRLARDVDRSASVVGGVPEGKPFRAHITLGRVRIGGVIDNFSAVAERISVERVTVPVEEIHLIRSRLGSGGPRYTIVGAWRIGATADGPDLPGDG